MGNKLGQCLLLNTTTTGPNGVLDMEEMCEKVTFVVTVHGTLSSFSLNLQGSQGGQFGQSEPYVTLQTVTAPGVYTFEGDLLRSFTADLTSISGASFPNNTLSVTVAAVPHSS